MQGTKNLTKGPINHQLFKLAMPIMATSFIQMAYSLTDMAWVGHLGSESVAAVGSVGILTWMSGSIALLNKVGAEVSVGQSIGSCRSEDARAFASHNITIALLISLCWGGLLFIGAHPILNLFRLKADITQEAIGYLRIVSTGLPFVFLTAVFTGIYNASGRSKVPFYISGTGLIMNMLLDPLFIYYFEWGTKGAAFATWISEAMVFCIFLFKIRIKDDLLGGFTFLTFLNSKYTFRIFKLGLPAATLNTLFAFVNMFLSRTAAIQGGHIGLMAFTTGGQIEAITWNTSQGFSTALSSFVAQNYAAGRKQRVKQAWYITLKISTIFGLICSLGFIFYGSEIFSLFVPEAEACRVGGDYLRIDGYSQIFMMIEITMQGIFYGVGHTWPPAIVSICGNYLRIPLAFLLIRQGLGVDAIWWAVCCTTVLKGITLLCWFFRIKKIVLCLLLSIIFIPLQAQQTNIYSTRIHTVKLTTNNDLLSYPIIRLNSNDVIQISFDDLSAESHHYRYRLTHCNADWCPSKMIESDFLEGFNDNPIENYNPSIGTTTSYIHYSLSIPNEEVRPKLSGNYLLSIYEDDEHQSTLFTTGFRIAEELVETEISISGDTDIDHYQSHQQLSLTIRHPQYTIRNAAQELHIQIYQNNRTDNFKILSIPSFIGRNELRYEHRPELIFPGGNEYRRFEIISPEHTSLGVESISYHYPFYHVTLHTEGERSQNYLYDQDQNGRFVIRGTNDINPDLEADYFLVHFSFPQNQQLLSGKFYLQGAFTYGSFKPFYELTYNPNKNTYECSLLLKQGIYNYQYLYLPTDSQSGLTAPTEGDFHQTENEYLILVYHKKPTEQYDRLISSRIISYPKINK